MNEFRSIQYADKLRRASHSWWRNLPPKRRRWALIGAAVGAAVLVAVVWRIIDPPQQKAHTRGAGGPSTVSVAAISQGDLGITVNALGTVTPLATVTVKPQVSGQITKIDFTEGQMVSGGDELAVIDPRPFQAALDQAQGQLLRDQAALENAKVDLKRYQTLLAQDSIAHQQVDSQAALVRQSQATVQSDQGLVETAALNLDYSHIKAPVAGRVGLRQVDLGNYVEAGLASGIVVITQVQPISVVFALPEDSLVAVQKRMKSGQPLIVTVYDRANTTKLAASSSVTLDNQIDTTTGTFKLRAQFPNDDGALFPNQFVNVRVLVDELHDVALAPSAAVQYGASGSFVYVVGQDDTVAVRPVTPGPSDGMHVAINNGVQVGERVVTDGVDRLRDGAKVVVAQQTGSAGITPQGKKWQGQRNGGKPGQHTASRRRTKIRHRERRHAPERRDT